MPAEPVRRAVRVLNEQGLHARPVARLVETARRFRADIRLSTKGTSGETSVASAKEIMDVLVLALPFGARVLIEAEGDDADEAVRALAEAFADRFGTED